MLQENTHVCSGGRVVAFEHMQAIAEMARAQGVPVHLDGARIFNAATALGRPASDLAQLAETVSFNLNKGLCAPLGAILAGTSDFVNDALRVRQMFGGGWLTITGEQSGWRKNSPRSMELSSIRRQL